MPDVIPFPHQRYVARVGITRVATGNDPKALGWEACAYTCSGRADVTVWDGQRLVLVVLNGEVMHQIPRPDEGE